MANVYLALGSNINKRVNIKKCILLIKDNFKINKISSVYETSPIGYKTQPDFYNLVVEIETNFAPEKLFERLISIEKKLKRKRIKKNYPRTIDIDILFYNKRIIKTKSLVIPHPRLHKRAFVLVPLNEIVPNLRHIVFKKTVKQLLWELKKSEIIKRVNSL